MYGIQVGWGLVWGTTPFLCDSKEYANDYLMNVTPMSPMSFCMAVGVASSLAGYCPWCMGLYVSLRDQVVFHGSVKRVGFELA